MRGASSVGTAALLVVVTLAGRLVVPTSVPSAAGPPGGPETRASPAGPLRAESAVLPPTVGGISTLATESTATGQVVTGNEGNLTVNATNSVVYDPTDQLLFVAGGDPFVAALNSRSYEPIQEFPSGASTPVGGLLYSPATQDIYAADSGTSSVTVISSAGSVIANVSVGADPVALAYSVTSHDVYVADGYGANISIVGSANTVIGNLSTGSGEPVQIAYDPANEDVYCAT